VKFLIVGADIKPNNTFSSKECLLAANERQLIEVTIVGGVGSLGTASAAQTEFKHHTHMVFHLAVCAGGVRAVNLHGYPSPPSQLYPTLEERPLPSLISCNPASPGFFSQPTFTTQASRVCVRSWRKGKTCPQKSRNLRPTQRKRHVHE